MPEAKAIPDGAERIYPEPNWGPSWEVPDIDVSFPAGEYIFALGMVRPAYDKDADPTTAVPVAVLNEIWVLKFLGTEEAPMQQERIISKDGQVTMGIRGTKMVERYPNPTISPGMAWRAKAFFSKFECISEKNFGAGDAERKGVKVVDWGKVREKFGTIFRGKLVYKPSKSDPDKRYRNFDYESIVVTGHRLEFLDMCAIQDTYATLKAAEDAKKAAGGTAEAPASADDLPF